MMSRIIGDTACPACRAKGRDSTGNHLMIFEDGGKYCNRCGYTVKRNIEEPEEFGENAVLDMETINKLPSKHLRARGIRQDIAERYGVKVAFDTSTGEDNAYCYPIRVDGQIEGYKVRELPKKFITVGQTKGLKVEPMGLHECQQSGKKIVVCGGQDDMLAAAQMLQDYADSKYGKGKYPPNVISLTRGEKDVQCIADHLDRINQFEEIILCLDMDEVGKETTNKLASLLGTKAKVMKLSEKDPNDMLMKGKQAEFINAFFSAKVHAPDGFVTVEDIWEEATAMPVWGKPWPWPSLTKLTYGRRLGEGIYFGAGVKVGKSEAVNQISHHIITEEKGKIALFKLEEKPAMTARKIAGKIMHKQFHVPDGPFTQEELKEGVDKVRNGVLLYDSYGATGWDKLKAAIRHAVVAEGCQDIVIDPLTRLTVGMNAADQNTELERISDEISKMAKDLGFFYMIFCHLKAPQTGKPHEEGGRVHSNQFHGSRAMMRACYYMVGIERDKTAEDETERNTSQFVLLEDRAFGNSGRFDVFYNRDTGDYLEPERPF